MMTLLLVAIAAQEVEARDEDSGFAVTLPAGWRVTRSAAGMIRGNAEKGHATVAARESSEPLGLARMAEQVAKDLRAAYEGLELVKEEDLAAAGGKGRLMHLKVKEKPQWIAVIPRSPKEWCVVETGETDEATAKKIAGSVRFFDPAITADQREAMAKATAALKDAKMPAAYLGETHLVLRIGGRLIAVTRRTMREATVAGRAGYILEFEQSCVEPERVTSATKAAVSFLLDGSYQKEEQSVELEWKGQPKQAATFVAVHEKEKAAVSRTLGGETVDVSREAPAGTYLRSLVDATRAALAVKGRSVMALRLLDGFAARPIMERLEIHEPERMSVGGEQRVIRVVLAKYGSHPSSTVLIDEAGQFVSITTPRLEADVKRVSREEYDEAKRELAKRK